MTADNLWGDLPKAESLKSPKKLLQEQADLLSQITGDHLRGHVSTQTLGEQIVHELEIIAPYINNYRVTVLRVAHGPIIYPAQVVQAVPPHKAFVCNDNVLLIQCIRDILQSAEVRKMLASLITQSMEE